VLQKQRPSRRGAASQKQRWTRRYEVLPQSTQAKGPRERLRYRWASPVTSGSSRGSNRSRERAPRHRSGRPRRLGRDDFSMPMRDEFRHGK